MTHPNPPQGRELEGDGGNITSVRRIQNSLTNATLLLGFTENLFAKAQQAKASSSR